MTLFKRMVAASGVLAAVALVLTAAPSRADAKLLELQLRIYGGGLAGIYGTGDYDPVNSTDAEAAAGEDFFKSRRGAAFGGSLNVEVLFVDLTYEFYQLADDNGLGSTLNNFLVGFDWDFRAGRRWVVVPYLLAGFGLATQNNSWLSKEYPQIALDDLQSRMVMTRLGIRFEYMLGRFFRIGFDIGLGYHYGITTATAANDVEEGHSHGFHVIGNVSFAFVWNVFQRKKKKQQPKVIIIQQGGGAATPPPPATPPTRTTPDPAPPRTTPAPAPPRREEPVPAPRKPVEEPPPAKRRAAPTTP